MMEIVRFSVSKLQCKLSKVVINSLEMKIVRFRVRLFRLQMNSGNQFPENGAFGCDGKYYFPEMNFLLTEI